MKRLASSLIILATASLLAGCAGLARTNNATQFSYDTSMLNDIAKRGGTLLVLRGEPFPDAAGGFEQRASRVLTTTHRGPEFPVFTKPAQTSEGNPWRTVLIVNPDRAVSASNVCTYNGTGAAVTEDGRMAMVAALCLGERTKTIVRSWGSDVSGPDSAAVDQMLRQTALSLYPTRDEDRDLDSPGGDFDR